MADSPETVPDREDPVLVRPYIKTTGVAAQERGPDEVWPETASMPATEDTPEPDPAAEADTAVQPAVPGTLPPYGLGVAPRLLILAAGVVVALAAVAFVLFDSSGPDPVRPSTALPAATGPAPTSTATAGTPPPSAGPSGSTASPSAGASTQASPSTSAALSSAPTPAPTATATATATVAPPPAVDRTGAITAAGGRCLALGGLLGIDGSPIQVYGCMDISAQEFTLAADGTLRVGGKCARPNDDASVRVAGCDGQATGQWRPGPNGTLVNGDRCLTDPGRAGANVRVAACGGGPEQSWTLP